MLQHNFLWLQLWNTMYLQSTYNISPYSMQYYKITFLKYERLKDLDILKQRIACFHGPGHLLKFFFFFPFVLLSLIISKIVRQVWIPVKLVLQSIVLTFTKHYSDGVLILFWIDVYILILFGWICVYIYECFLWTSNSNVYAI